MSPAAKFGFGLRGLEVGCARIARRVWPLGRFFVVAVGCIASTSPSSAQAIPADADVTGWGCYDPEPGHPTTAEKLAFVRDVSVPALEAERTSGVPAPALAAMAIVESGYGFTRTALAANNLFGFKWTPGGAAGWPSYILACQPAWDVGNKYVKFPTRTAAIAFVAGKLSALPAYANATNAFKAAAHGTGREAAVVAWVRAIANPYNYRPAAYTRSVVRLINDPISPSDTVDPIRTLFKLDPSRMTPRATGSPQ